MINYYLLYFIIYYEFYIFLDILFTYLHILIKLHIDKLFIYDNLLF